VGDAAYEPDGEVFTPDLPPPADETLSVWTPWKDSKPDLTVIKTSVPDPVLPLDVTPAADDEYVDEDFAGRLEDDEAETVTT